MSGDFLGTFENSVNKQRIIIPAPFKAKFSHEADQSAIVTIGPNQSIAIYPLDNWKSLKEKAANGDDRAKRFLNNLIDFACPEQALEGPGRIRISDELLDIANISETVIIKGEGSYITLWNPEKFKEMRVRKLSAHQSEFNSMDYQL
ncbi:MAG TPA: protein MraZ [Candidatus Cloacimonadota bacterium]|nr:protein MraZ [Candidatus Cloacimonadota bacterium]HOD54517.1 protein MraZ [Candidatus Cloacimonadota bacterium]HPM00596.1 protein MraZ [Candidatus Cloacimonadota bacterium]